MINFFILALLSVWNANECGYPAFRNATLSPLYVYEQPFIFNNGVVQGGTAQSGQNDQTSVPLAETGQALRVERGCVRSALDSRKRCPEGAFLSDSPKGGAVSRWVLGSVMVRRRFLKGRPPASDQTATRHSKAVFCLHFARFPNTDTDLSPCRRRNKPNGWRLAPRQGSDSGPGRETSLHLPVSDDHQRSLSLGGPTPSPMRARSHHRRRKRCPMPRVTRQ